MFCLGLFRTRRRRTGSALIIIPLLAVWFGHDQWGRSQQTKEAWQGTIVRAYQEKPFWGTRRTSAHRCWDVRSSNGELHTVRVYARSLWSAGVPGQYVVKNAGELDPDLYAR